MAKEDSIFQPQVDMRRYSVPNRTVHFKEAAKVPNESELVLNVVTVYQDPLTRHWAAELWDRVGRLIDSGGICRKAWNVGDLMRADVFADAVKAAAEAHVLVISVRDAGQLPVSLCIWIDAWMPNRVGPVGGALVALIGVPPQPDTQSGRAYAYLESVAKRAGLDYLPNERKLPSKALAPPALVGIMPAANIAARWREGSTRVRAGGALD